MQIIDSRLRTALEEHHEVIGKPLIIAEWNFNRIIKTTVTNISDPNNKLWAYTKNSFPPSSLTDGFRPDAGMIYGFTGKARPISNAQLGPGGKRYYIVTRKTETPSTTNTGGPVTTPAPDQYTPYQYWVSPTPSDPMEFSWGDAEPAPGQYAIKNSDLKVQYASNVKANKIKITFNDDIRPAKWKIYVKYKDAADFDPTPIADTPSINSSSDVLKGPGRCELWWDGNAWTQTQQVDVTKYREINAIKVEVQTLAQPNERLHIIEIAAMREIDITDRTQSFSSSMSLDNADYIHPVGQMSSNDGSIVIDNRDLALDFFDTLQDYYGLMDGWCEYRSYIDFDISKYTTDPIEPVRISTMYSNGWEATSPYTFNIQLFDIVKILQSLKAPVIYAEKKSIARIVSMLLDLVGIDKYEFDFADFDDSGIVQYFWSDGTQSVYDVLNDLCKSYQCIMFTDELGRIQLKTRTQIANDTDSASFTLWGEDTTVHDVENNVDLLKLANIVDLKKKWSISINDVEIKYKRREANIDAQDVTGKVLTSKVWDTSDSIVIKASPLVRVIPQNEVPVTGNDPRADAWVSSSNAETWPYKGYVNIDGETMRYEGKGYIVFDYSGVKPTWGEKLLLSDEDRRKWDKFTYDSYKPNGAPGGNPSSGVTIPAVQADPLYANKISGRLRVVERGLNGSSWAEHSNTWINGWMGFNVWWTTASNSLFPGTYIEPGKSIGWDDLKNNLSKPNWGREQSRWSVRNSVISCDNMDKSEWYRMSALVRDLGTTEYREFGTRIRFGDGTPAAGIIFCISDKDGYETSDPTLDNVMMAHRFYILNVHSTALIDGAGRTSNEISVQGKNGDEIYNLNVLNGGPDAGKIQLDKGKWYDVEIVVNDMAMIDGTTAMRIEVFVNGQYVNTWMTNDVIHPTNYAGVISRYSGVVDFEYFYATTTSGHSRPLGSNENAFSTLGVQLPAGQNMTQVVNFGTDASWPARTVFSLASTSSITLTSIELYDPFGNNPLKNLGPVTVPADTRRTWILDDYPGAQRGTFIKLKYSSTDDVSVAVETSKIGSIPYFEEKSVYPNDYSYYSLQQGGYVSSKRQGILNAPVADFDYGFSNDLGVTSARGLYYDDFGSIVREIRDFNIDLSVSPAKGTALYVSNPEVFILKNKYNPKKGIFSLVNGSHQDQIVNGQEQVDANNTIDHSLMMYGYILVDKEDKTKRVKNEDSIRTHGSFTASFDASWITTDTEAEALAAWVVSHWGGNMDTIDVKVFSNVYAQIGDKVNIVYGDAQVKPDWLFVVAGIQRDFDDAGLTTGLTLRRVR